MKMKNKVLRNLSLSLSSHFWPRTCKVGDDVARFLILFSVILFKNKISPPYKRQANRKFSIKSYLPLLA